MTDRASETSPQTFDMRVVTAAEVVTIPEVLASAPGANGSAQYTEAQMTVIGITPESQNETATATATQSTALRRLAAGGALAGFMLLGGAASAEAAEPTPTTTTAEAQGQQQDSNLNNTLTELLSVGTIMTTGLIAVATIRSQTKEKKADRFAATLGAIKGESTGEERLARLRALEPFAHNPHYAPEVFKSTVGYLRGRRGGLETLRKLHADNPDELEYSIRERRNADRSAFLLMLETLPAARKEVRQGVCVSFIKRLFGRKDKFEKLAELTGTFVEREKPRVNASGINLDDMRDIKKVDLHDVNLTGAGMQRLQITNSDLSDARMCEVQLEGTRFNASNLSGTDLRAAYFFGATIENCIVSKDTQLGHLPENHPDAKLGSLDPKNPDKYRGDPAVVIKNLISDTLSPQEIVHLVHDWQRNGLQLIGDSNPEYFLTPELSADQPAR